MMIKDVVAIYFIQHMHMFQQTAGENEKQQ